MNVVGDKVETMTPEKLLSYEPLIQGVYKVALDVGWGVIRPGSCKSGRRSGTAATSGESCFSC